jgi:prepilin-type N-terminal cleavage/methylation domain-containing protein
MRRERGVTLIELLVAISLMLLLAVSLVTTLRIGVTTVDRVKDRFEGNRRALSAQRILEAQLGSLIFTQAECLAPSGNYEAAPFFQGDETEMRFVTGYSIGYAHRGPAVALELKVIPNEEGGVRLIANERPFAGGRSLGSMCFGKGPAPDGKGVMTRFHPVTAGPGSFVLADRLAGCRFVYQRREIGTNKEMWLRRWAFEELPSAIRVELAAIEPVPGRVPLLTVTAPMRVTRGATRNYVDVDPQF